MNIVLIKPEEPGLADQLAYPPMGLLYIGAVLERAGHRARLHVLTDGDYTGIPFGQVYGINMHSPGTYKNVQNIASYLKERDGQAIVIAGGAFATSYAEKVIANSNIDYVVIGEGELTITDLMDAIQYSENPRQVNGIAFGDKNMVHVTEPRPAIQDLNNLPMPARHLMPPGMIDYQGKVHHLNSGERSTTLIVSRGCPFNCAFCDRQIWGRKWRARHHSNILFEIEHCMSHYDVHWFRFVDDNMLANRKWFTGLVQKIKELCDVSWTCLARADNCDSELLKAMAAAGCKEIFFGCESGSQALLNKMNKITTVETNVKAIQMCRDAGIKSCAYMMFGFPGEDERTVEETKEFLHRAKPDKSRISTFLPIPGSDVFANPEKYNVTIDFDPDRFWYFDQHDFAVNYGYPSNQKMAELRNDMMNFYREMGYQDGWTK